MGLIFTNGVFVVECDTAGDLVAPRGAVDFTCGASVLSTGSCVVRSWRSSLSSCILLKGEYVAVIRALTRHYCYALFVLLMSHLLSNCTGYWL